MLFVDFQGLAAWKLHVHRLPVYHTHLPQSWKVKEKEKTHYCLAVVGEYMDGWNEVWLAGFRIS